jgi:phosphoribosylformylglycinamidine (FGAM) synthase-like enzyme
MVFLLGNQQADDSSLSGSEYLAVVHGLVMGNLTIDIELEKRLHGCCIELINKGIINSAHDCSEGGLLVCLAESCLANKLGFLSQEWRTEGRLDTALFGEVQSRIIISLPPAKIPRLEKITSKWRIAAAKLGTVGGNYLTLKHYANISVKKMEKAWLGGLGA